MQREPALVLPTLELRWLSRTWLAVGVLVLAADLASGKIRGLSSLELAGTLGVLALSVVGSVAGKALGVRTPPSGLYSQVFDRARVPPPGLGLEPTRLTASRAGWAAIGVAGMLGVLAPVAVGAALILLATPTDRLLEVLPGCAALEASGWILACSLAAHQLRSWFLRWEGRRGRVLLCPPLASGRLAPVYFAAPRVAGRQDRGPTLGARANRVAD